MSLMQEIETILKMSNGSKIHIRTEIIKLYNLLNSASIDPNKILIEQENEIKRWLSLNRVIFISSKKEEYTKRAWFTDEFDKKSYLSQFHCKICDIEGLRIFPIRINPKSRQTTTLIKNKFQELIGQAPYAQKKLNKNDFQSTDRICLKLVFVINKSRDKDIDNMAKMTLDGLKKVLIPDDRQIDHLELIKFKAKYLEEFISVSIGRSHLNNTDNIIFNGSNLGWAGLPKMEI